MVRESYQKQLDGLVEGVLEMGRQVLEGLEMGLQAIRAHDRELAESLDEWDDRIDRLNLELEKQCTDLLALQQPVAIDLRLIVSVFKIVTDLERAADLAVNLGEYAMVSGAFVLVSKEELLHLGEFACAMLQESLEAFKERDVERARAIIGRDRQMDQRCWDLRTEVLGRLIAGAREAHSPSRAEEIAANTITILWSIRDLERVADHAVNICARTIYWLTANPEHI